MRIATATAVALALIGTAAPAATAHQLAGADGLWRMDGYGTVLSIRNGTLQEYQTTAISCVKGDAAKRTAPHTYQAPDGEVITVRVRGDRASLHLTGSVGDRNLRRIPALPAACTRPVTQKGPLATFDVFWQSFEENYPFFAAKGIDWHKVRDQYRPKVHARTTKAELFTVFSKMVAPLYDSHVAVRYGDRTFAQGRPGTVLPGATLDAKVTKLVVQRDLKDARNIQDFANGRITYADLPGGQGYLRISGFGGYVRGGAPYAAQLAQLDKALDTILTAEHTKHLKGLIVDLRVHGGGSDAMGLHLAGRLTDTPYFAYAKRARNHPTDPTRHTRPQPLYVTPAPAPRYTGPVAVLTGGSTVSAAETFTQALMDRPAKTVRIGQPTQGVFSDGLERELPNGMTALMPNEEFLTHTGNTYDGTGIPPHIVEPVFTTAEFAKKRDSAFDKALNVLRK